MDQIDINLLEAWNSISAAARQDRLDALRRSNRRFNATFTRPMRAWCLCLRANDTRISNYNAAIEFPLDTFLDMDDPVDDALARGETHSITISGDWIRELTKPVSIDYPGIDSIDAAQRLGMHPESLRSWMKRGVFNIDLAPATVRSKRGKPVPVIWAPAPLDPNSNCGQPPDEIWGCLWQTLWKRLPEDYALTVQRVARRSPYATKNWDEGECHDLRQRGWSFVCPGRSIYQLPEQSEPEKVKAIDPRNRPTVHVPCGRLVKRLYGPQSVWTIAQALGDEQGFEMPPESSLSGLWLPGMSDPVKTTGPRTFACHHCWRVRYTSMVDRGGWNEFVMHLSGGLLYGHEVNRPLEEAPFRRKRAYRPCVNRAPSKRRAQVLELLIEGLTYERIASRLGVGYATVRGHVVKLFRQHDVHSIAELCAALHRTAPPRNNGKREHVTERRSRVKALRRTGLTYRQIAERLGITLHVVHHDMNAINKSKTSQHRRFKNIPREDASVRPTRTEITSIGAAS